MNALATSPLSAFGAALLGGAVVLFLLARLGRGEVSGRLWLDALSIGAVMGALIGFVEAPLSLHSQSQAWSAAANAFGFAGFPEEAAKFAGAYWLLRTHYRVRAPRDLVLASAAVGLGFALLENVLYVEGAGASWGEVAFSRAGTSVPFHVFLALTAGWAMARTDNWLWLGLVWVGLSFLHGSYDFALLVMEGKSPFPQDLLWLPPKLGLSDTAALTTLLLGSVAITCVTASAGAWAATRRPLAPPRPPAAPQPDSGSERLLYGRTSGLLLGLALILLYLVLLIIQGAAYAMLGQGIAGPLALSHAAPALTAGALLIAFPPRRSHPLSRAAKFGWLAAAAVTAALIGVAGWRWGAGPLRDLRVARDLAEGSQARAGGDLARARGAFDAALELDPNSGAAHSGRAQVENAMMHYEDAVKDMDAAVNAEPNNVGYLLMRIEILKNLHRERDALADVDRAIKLAPREAGLWSSRAEIDHELGIDSDANRDIARAFQLGPDNQNVLRVRGELYLDEGNLDQAENALDIATAHDPTDIGVRFARGRLRYYRENYSGAIEDLTFVEQRNNDLYPSLWLFLARARAGLGLGEGFIAHIKGIEGRWPAPVGRRFLGEISAEEMRSAAVNDDQRCEADFYDAAFLSPTTPREQTLAAMRKVYAECPVGYVEREGAFAAVRKLAPAESAASSLASPMRFSVVDQDKHVLGASYWNFRPEGAGELSVAASLADQPAHAELKLAPGPTPDLYRLTFTTPPAERSSAPFARLGSRLGPILIDNAGVRTQLRDDLFLRRLDDDTFGAEIPAAGIAEILDRLAHAERLAIEFGPAAEERNRLVFELGAPGTAAVAEAARRWSQDPGGAMASRPTKPLPAAPSVADPAPTKVDADEPDGFTMRDQGLRVVVDAHWAFLPENGGELAVSVALLNQTGHGKLRLAPGPDTDTYRLSFSTLAGERVPPFSELGSGLGPIMIERTGVRSELRPGLFLKRVNDDSFAADIPASAFPQTLGRLAASDRLIVEFGPPGFKRSALEFEIRDNSRKTILAAASQFR